MNYGMDYQGGGGGGGGGGFQSQSGGGGFAGGGGSQSGGRARRSYDEQTCIPATIRMVLSSVPSDPSEGGTGSLQLDDGRKISRVRIVGAIRSYEDMSTNCLYSIEDGTGLVEVKQWLDDSACSAVSELRAQTLKEHIYVKVVGTVKDYDGKKQVLADCVRPIKTGNELTHHVLEVVYSGEKHKRATSYVPSPQGAFMGGGVGFGGPVGGGVGVPLAAGGGAGSAGGDNLRDAVIHFIRTEGDAREEGVDVQECIRRLTSSGNHTEGAIRNVVSDLAAEGVIYSTFNEDMYKFAMM